MRELSVFINNQICGNLCEESQKYIFNYGDYASKIVSVTMPIRKESWTDSRLHPIFQMNLPEGALKDALINSFGKYKKMDQMGFLEILGAHMLGRVKFKKEDNNEKTQTLDGVLFGDTQGVFNELLEKYSIKSGISGVQPKVLLDAYNKNTMLLEHYIVKSWGMEYPELAANEYFCMNACKRAGLVVPKYYLSENRNMFIMKRFDIKEDKSFYGFEDMCVLLGKDNNDSKYHSSYEEVAKTLKRTIAPENKLVAIKDFFKALIMNHLLRNGDAHLKNYAILYDTDYVDAKLAPIYDVVTTTVYLEKDIPALALGGAKLWWKKKTYDGFGKLTCQLKQSMIDEIIDICIDGVKKTKIELSEYINEHKDFAQFADKLQNEWREEIS